LIIIEGPKDLTFCEYQKATEEKAIREGVHAKISKEHEAERRQWAEKVQHLEYEQVKQRTEMEKQIKDMRAEREEEMKIWRGEMKTTFDGLSALIEAAVRLQLPSSKSYLKVSV